MLVDTSVWIDHFRRNDAALRALLDRNEAECHPFVIGELACGSLRRRSEILMLLERLPLLPQAQHAEVMGFVEHHGLFGSGIGWIDAHLLASAALARTSIWTRDRRLAEAAKKLALFAEH